MDYSPPSSPAHSAHDALLVFERHAISGNTFEIPARYSGLRSLHLSASSVSCIGWDRCRETAVAIKRIARPFGQPALARRTRRELILLRDLKHPNVSSLRDVFVSPDEDIYFVTDLMNVDLGSLLKDQKLEPEVVRFLLHQILRGLAYLHSNGLVHRDLKPSSILLNSKCELKISDFGHARAQEPSMTGYVATRRYRAPEIMLTWRQYGQGVDIWATGCILSEMINGQPLFPGTSHAQQWTLITNLLGTPQDYINREVHSELTLRFVNSLPFCEPQNLAKYHPSGEQWAIDLLTQMLLIDPARRITASRALVHPYLAPFRTDDDPTPTAVAIHTDYAADWDTMDEGDENDVSMEGETSKLYHAVSTFHLKALPKFVIPTWPLTPVSSADQTFANKTDLTADEIDMYLDPNCYDETI